MQNEKYIDINTIARAKGLKSNRSIRLEINKPCSKYISREISVNGGKSYEILYSTLEPEIQDIIDDEEMKCTSLVPIQNDFKSNFVSESARLTALARVDIVIALNNIRKKYKTTVVICCAISASTPVALAISIGIFASIAGTYVNKFLDGKWEATQEKFNMYSYNIGTKIEENIHGCFLQSGCSQPIGKDPIIFDLNNDGILETTIIKDGRYFDHDNDGFAEASAWIGDNDGLLVIDIDNSSSIDNGLELITAETIGEYDYNNDGVIDEFDNSFNILKILKKDGQLYSLSELGIQSININTESVNEVDENGNTKFGNGTYTTTNGITGTFGEFILKTNPMDSAAIDILEETEEISNLPDIVGRGVIYSLHQAMLRDEELTNLVKLFINSNDENVRSNLIDEILIKWTNSENIEAGSRGENINAQHLSIMEKFINTNFWSLYEEENGSQNPQNPNLSAGKILETAYEQLKVYVYAELISQTELVDLIQEMKFDFAPRQGISIDLTKVVQLLKNELVLEPNSAKERIYQFAKVLNGFGFVEQSNFFDPKDDNCFYTTFTQNDRDLKWLIDTIGKVPFEDEIGDGEGSAADDSFRLVNGQSGHFHSLSGDDVIYGDTQNDGFAACSGKDLVDGGDGDDNLDTHGDDDIVWGGAGNDTIHASDGNDIIFGGDGDDRLMPDHGDEFNAGDGDDIVRGDKGNDHIISVLGNDTIIFQRGDGQDIVEERQGVDTLYFGPDIAWEDLIFEQSENNMIIKINNTEDQITIVDWFVTNEDGVYRYDNNKIEKFEFADGSIHTKDEITIGDNTEAITYNMDEIGEYTETPAWYKTIVNLKEGHNNIIGGRRSDDTYVVQIDGVNAVIEDYCGNNTIKFGEGICLAQTFFAINDVGFDVWFEHLNSYLDITGDVSNFRFEFADGTVITDLSNYVERTVSYSRDDDVVLQEGDIAGGVWDDQNLNVTGNNNDNDIQGNAGNNIMEGKEGNDHFHDDQGGDDTYVYNIGDGYDSIYDYNGLEMDTTILLTMVVTTQSNLEKELLLIM